MNAGIDYGHGKANIDTETGIRYGVIPMNSLSQFAWDDVESDYGEPHCPECGRELIDAPDDETAERREEYAQHKGRGCADYHCDACELSIDSSDVFSEEPIGHYVARTEFKATIDTYDDMFVLKSEYYTTCAFCSPCAPGAGYLTDYRPDGVRAYCPGPEWFDDEAPPPFPIFRVSDGTLAHPGKPSAE